DVVGRARRQRRVARLAEAREVRERRQREDQRPGERAPHRADATRAPAPSRPAAARSDFDSGRRRAVRSRGAAPPACIRDADGGGDRRDAGVPRRGLLAQGAVRVARVGRRVRVPAALLQRSPAALLRARDRRRQIAVPRRRRRVPGGHRHVRVGGGDYFRLSALLLAPFALAITLALRRRVAAARLLWWALGPPLLLYAFANWDLLAVAGAAGGLIALDEDRPALAGGALAFGASAKLFPLFFLPSAVASRWAAGDRRGAARVAIAFAAVACALNLPWLAISARGWLATWRFHARRYPDFGTLWYWIGRAGAALHPSPYWEPGQSGFRELAGALGLALFAAAAAWLVARGWRRKLPGAATALAVLCAFLLAATVHSPQYALWLLPVVVLADVPDPLIVGWLAADVVLCVCGLRL